MPMVIYKNAKGERIPSVTTVLSQLGWNKPALMYWAWNEGCEGRDYRSTSGAAADAGTLAHRLIECHIKKVSIDTSGYENAIALKAHTAFDNFIKWSQHLNFEVFATELSLVSEKHQYGGTIDCVAYIDGKLVILDWKTSNGTYEDHLIQLAAYAKLWDENHPELPIEDGAHLLRITKEHASFHHHHWSNLEMPFSAFLSARQLYNYKKQFKGLI